MAMILPFGGRMPEIHPSAFIAPTAILVGNVSVEAEASVWFGAVIRGDDPDHGIVVGARSSVQENCVVHVGTWGPTLIGRDVTVGHGAKFESCLIGDRSVVGMNAVILQRATIGQECVIAANAVVLEGADIPPRSVVAGVPGRVKKTLEGSAAEWIARGGTHYVELSRAYRAMGLGDPEAGSSRCDLCGGPVIDRHCKVVCLTCGYQRDCSDP
ncbi:MAG: gamma carbonic anhydrase family protein [Gemmatimonadota bacterium]|jgi:carbonic anhydrase/acetyltransferase-like protein (isoleucine patch superfamily)